MRIFYLIFVCLFSLKANSQESDKLFVTPEEFGCVSDAIEKAGKNADCFQRMIDYAIKNKVKIVSSANKKYYISKSLHIDRPIIIEFNGGLLIATDTIDMITIKRSHKNNRLNSGIISGLYLDLNKKAKSGLRFDDAVKVHVHDCWIYGIPQNTFGIMIQKGCGELFFNNLNLEGGENAAGGIKVNTHDCHFTDIAMIDCSPAVENSGSNFYERLHAWMGALGRWIDNSVFFRVTGGESVFLHQCFSDTFERAFSIESKTNLHISQHKNYHNKIMWNKDDDKINPLFFFFKDDSLAKQSNITLENSHIGGLIIKGKNRQKISNVLDVNIKNLNSIISY